MTKIDELKQKIEKVKQDKHDADTAMQVAQSLFPLYNKLGAKAKSQVTNNNTLVVKEMIEGLEEKIENQSFEEIVTALKEQSEGFNDENKKVVNKLVDLVKAVQQLGEKEYFDQNEFDTVFTQGLQKVVNTLIELNQIPNDTKYVRNDKDKITRVIEDYGDYKIVHTWTYNSAGSLVDVKTKRT